jgi:hypothetical protein
VHRYLSHLRRDSKCSTELKRGEWLLALAIVCIAGCGAPKSDTARREEEEAAARRAQDNAIISGIQERTQATVDWVEKLRGSGLIRLSPLLSIDVELAWVQDRPVLFVGDLTDVATADDSNYLVTLDKSVLRYPVLPLARLRMTLACQKQFVEPVLARRRSTDLRIFFPVAVAAQITEVRPYEVWMPEGERKTVFVGKGSCVEIAPLSETK